MFSRLLAGRTFLDPDVEAWHLETWAILLQRLGHFGQVRLVTPTRDFFPPSDAAGHERALHVLECVKKAMGMADWPCELEAQESGPPSDRLGEFWRVEAPPAPLGTFRVESDGRTVISYAPKLLQDPWGLVATLAHELSHYLLAPHHDALDGDTHELATDLTVAFAGFGLFGANNAFAFTQQGDAFSQGWSSRSNGYLAPRSWAFALAVFAHLKDDHSGMDAYLKPELARERRKASEYLGRRPALLEGLKALAA